MYTIDVNVLSEVEEAMKEIMLKEVNVFSALQKSIALQAANFVTLFQESQTRWPEGEIFSSLNCKTQRQLHKKL